METLTFTCRILTPMFLAGADGKTPELRAASIKGALRFWWRACNGQLGLPDMREEEHKIFGGVKPGDARRSGVMVRVKGNPRCDQFSMVPHKEDGKNPNQQHRGFIKSAFAPEEEFSLILSRKNNCPLSIDQLFSLTWIALTLGGLGRRSRRGMGSVELVEESSERAIPEVSIENLQTHLNRINIDNSNELHFEIKPSKSPEIVKGQDEVASNFKVPKPNAAYPFIRKIRLGSTAYATAECRFKDGNDLLYRISKETHTQKEDATFHNYSNAMGKAGANDRFASPLWISVVREAGVYKPIFTFLQIVYDHNGPKIGSSQNIEFQEKFASKLS